MMSHVEQQAGFQLRAVADAQLLDDLRHYGVDPSGMTIDWSDAVQEGHVTRLLGGMLEEASGLTVLDKEGRTVAIGWMDFIHGGGENDPLFVFWLFLDLIQGDNHSPLKVETNIPAHVWERLPDRTKELCAREGTYDARWSRDPLVRAWKRQHGNETDSTQGLLYV